MGVVVDADAYRRAAALLGEVVVSLADDEWGLPTVPSDWTAVTTLAWVVAGDALLAAAAAGQPIVPVRDFDSAVVGPNPVAAWRGTALSVLRALDGADLERVVAHPDGSVRLGDVVAQRVSENLVRAYDIGRAVNRPVNIPSDLADACLEFWAAHGEAVVRGGLLPDDPCEPPPGADEITRFLALMGRSGVDDHR